MKEKNEFVIQDAAAWVLRIGVLSSTALMLGGLAIVEGQGLPAVDRMRQIVFNDHPAALLHGALAGDGLSIVQLGILALVLTPVLRVAVSMVLFAVVDRDWLYSVVTLVVLALTLGSLLALKHVA